MQVRCFIVAALAVVGMSLFGQAASAGSIAQNGAAAIERQVADASQSAVTQVQWHRRGGHRGGRFFRGGRGGGGWGWGAPFAFYGVAPYGGYSPIGTAANSMDRAIATTIMVIDQPSADLWRGR